jgi:hypothetical protein
MADRGLQVLLNDARVSFVRAVRNFAGVEERLEAVGKL